MPDAAPAAALPARGTLLGFDFGLARIGIATGPANYDNSEVLWAAADAAMYASKAAGGNHITISTPASKDLKPHL